MRLHYVRYFIHVFYDMIGNAAETTISCVKKSQSRNTPLLILVFKSPHRRNTFIPALHFTDNNFEEYFLGESIKKVKVLGLKSSYY